MDFAIFFASFFVFNQIFQINLTTTLISSAVLPLSWLYVLWLKDFYTLTCEHFLKRIYYLFEGFIIVLIISGSLLLFFNFDKSYFIYLIITTLVSFSITTAWRALFYKYTNNLKAEKNVLIIGAGHSGQRLAQEITNHPELKLNIAGFVDDDQEKQNYVISGKKVLGASQNLDKIFEEHKINFVFLCITGKIKKTVLLELSKIINSNKNFKILKYTTAYEYITQKTPVKTNTADYFLTLVLQNKKPFYKIIKRLFDIYAASIIAILTSPIMLFVACSIKFADGGKIFYIQERIGKDGKPFKVYKFRTMIENADKEGMVDKGNTQDNRILPFCAIIRKARFDELPQMFNILKGEMSIVGPRPEFIEFVKEYEQKIPFYKFRHSVTPGWTGWAQINYGHCVNVDDIIEKLRYDFYYIKNRNIFWDFSILVKAVGMALSGRHS